MDTKRPSGDESSAVREGVPSHRVSRRGFTRAGLSGSVLLGSLTSKPVLGAASVGCTVSGQMSGNLSREALTFDCRVGRSVAYWLGQLNWPSPFLKGTLPQGNCNFGGQTTQGTFFNGWTPGGAVPALASTFFRVDPQGSTTCTVTTTSPGADNANTRATMLQVLNSTDPGDQFRLGRIVVASLLNIANLGEANYPVTYHTVIAMFNDTFNGGDYVVGTVTWSRARVIQYLESLVS